MRTSETRRRTVSAAYRYLENVIRERKQTVTNIVLADQQNVCSLVYPDGDGNGQDKTEVFKSYRNLPEKIGLKIGKGKTEYIAIQRENMFTKQCTIMQTDIFTFKNTSSFQ